MGKKLENPYKTQNMDKALQNLKSKGKRSPVESITTNYLYVRLLPKTTSEYNLINADTTIDTYEYPLDYEILETGNKYQDKSLINEKFNWIYCAIPKDKSFDKKIKMEVLDELFLPFGNGKESPTEFEENEAVFLSELENEALIITGNFNSTHTNKRGINTWFASGRIRVWDDRIHYNDSNGQFVAGAGLVPVAYCQVRANRWFTTKITLANANGTFFINHAWGNGDGVNYSIKWDRPTFDIRDGNYGQAYFNGPKLETSWNLDIFESGTPESYAYAHVHRAAIIYYYENAQYGIQTPAQPWYIQSHYNDSKLHINVNDEDQRSHFFAWNSTWEAAPLKCSFNLNNEDSRQIFATTIHELAHTSHWTLGFSYANYLNFNSSKLAESWAQCVGWFITRDIYAAVSDPGSPWRGVDDLQLRLLSDLPGDRYTPLFIDLIDDFNQNLSGSNRPNDQANNYSLGSLEDILSVEPTNWTNYRNFLRDNTSNSSEAQALALFDSYDQ